jgi:hypothetical protein
MDYLKTLAISRLVLDNFANLSFLGYQGAKVAQMPWNLEPTISAPP